MLIYKIQQVNLYLTVWLSLFKLLFAYVHIQDFSKENYCLRVKLTEIIEFHLILPTKMLEKPYTNHLSAVKMIVLREDSQALKWNRVLCF